MLSDVMSTINNDRYHDLRRVYTKPVNDDDHGPAFDPSALDNVDLDAAICEPIEDGRGRHANTHMATHRDTVKIHRWGENRVAKNVRERKATMKERRREERLMGEGELADKRARAETEKLAERARKADEKKEKDRQRYHAREMAK